jgi:cobalt/nickel transport system permease protein
MSALPGVAGDLRSPVHRLGARVKVLGLLGVTVAAVAAGPEAWPVWAACAALLAAVAAAAGVPAGLVARRAAVVLPVVLLAAAALPLVRQGGAAVRLGPLTLWEEGLLAFAAVAAKAGIGTCAAVLLGATTPFPETLRALERLRVPRLFVAIARTMHRYVPVVAGEVRRTRTALRARAFRPRSALGAAPVGRIAGTLFLRAHARGERVHRAMLARTPEPTGATGPGPAIDARGLRFSYGEGRPALDGVDLRVEHGERVAVLGPNGAGKTTLMLLLDGLLQGEGELVVAGIDARGRRLRELRARVGLVFQDPDDQLFMPTVGEDVAFGPRNLGLAEAEVARRTAGALAAVGLAGAEGRAPHALSGGERRRAAIATVLAMDPEVLVLDEPSSGLDPRGRRELLELLRGLGRTLVLVTHDLPFAAALCDRAVVLSAGRVVADGPCAQVLADGGLLAAHDLEGVAA